MLCTCYIKKNVISLHGLISLMLGSWSSDPQYSQSCPPSVVSGIFNPPCSASGVKLLPLPFLAVAVTLALTGSGTSTAAAGAFFASLLRMFLLSHFFFFLPDKGKKR